ncbi:MAG: type I restriction enzyme HsdR N-terminal domain-containing protein [Cyclobacteriaceae bacterium]|nr:type I restriction enzyme HsdR N-terminal domain-containing protein [Cyclobacteriaceae bacterium]
MIKLNLPTFDYKLRKADGKVWIFDGIRKKYVVLTPEEWVRQHLVHYLIHERAYPKALVKIEVGLKYNTLSKRSDIVLFNRQGSPWMIVECKAPEIELTSLTAQQISVYNQTLKADYLLISNGMKLICYQASAGYTPLTDLPNFPD